MEDGGPDSTQLIDQRRNFDDTYAEVSAWSVPESARFPEGVKYSMQYGETETGDTIFRYDNFPDHPDAPPHHKHTESGDVTGVDFEGVRELYKRFREEVRKHGNEWD